MTFRAVFETLPIVELPVGLPEPLRSDSPRCDASEPPAPGGGRGGSLEHTSEGYVARVTLKHRKRESYLLSSCKTEAQAEERKQLLAGCAARFRKAGVIDTKGALDLLKTIATAAPALLPTALEVVVDLRSHRSHVEPDDQPLQALGEEREGARVWYPLANVPGDPRAP